MQLPTILFFAGAFADPSCFDTLTGYFHKAGYPTAYAHVATLNPPNPARVSTSLDAEVTRKKALLPLLDAGKDVVVFTHSYGGVVGGAAAAGLSKRSRVLDNKRGGVIGFVYLAGNIVGENSTLLETVGGAYPEFIKQNNPSKGLAVISPVMETLYNDADPALKPQLEAAMIPHALRAFETPASAPAWAEHNFNERRAYIRTLDDNCNPLFLQDKWRQDSGVTWETASMKTSHCPFISVPEQVAKVTIGFIKKWI